MPDELDRRGEQPTTPLLPRALVADTSRARANRSAPPATTPKPSPDSLPMRSPRAWDAATRPPSPSCVRETSFSISDRGAESMSCSRLVADRTYRQGVRARHDSRDARPRPPQRRRRSRRNQRRVPARSDGADPAPGPKRRRRHLQLRHQSRPRQGPRLRRDRPCAPSRRTDGRQRCHRRRQPHPEARVAAGHGRAAPPAPSPAPSIPKGSPPPDSPS